MCINFFSKKTNIPYMEISKNNLKKKNLRKGKMKIKKG